MGRESVIAGDPEILGGTPCFRGTRVLVDFRSDYLEADDTLEKFLSRSPAAIHEAALAPPSIKGPDRPESAAHAGLPNRHPHQDLIWLDGPDTGRTIRDVP